MSENRGHPRLPVKIKVDFTSDDAVRSAFSLNISAGGIYLATSKPLPSGDTVVLQLYLPSLDGPVEVLGEVVWSNAHPDGRNDFPEGMGIRFTNLSSFVEEHLGTFQTARTGNS